MDSAGLFVYGLAVAVALLLVIIYDRCRFSELDAIPAIGPSGALTSWLGAFRFIKHAPAMVQEGYQKHKGGMFRVPLIDRWVVVLTGPRLIEELRKVPEDELSFDHAMRDLLQVKYTFGIDAQEYPYHVQVTRNHLSRNLQVLFPDVCGEINHAFDAIMPSDQDGWAKVRIYPEIMKAMCRVSNRIFVGLPLCRSPEFEALQQQFALQVVLRATLVNFFPKFAHPIIGRLLTNTPSSIRRCMAILEPIVQGRLENIEQCKGEWNAQPNDMISWLIDVSDKEHRNLRSICLRILVLNFAALHTSAQSFTHALLNLATYPQYCTPLREEASAVINQDGWTKDAMKKLNKMDSFLKESQRFSGTTLFPMMRKAMRPFVFSDGTVIPSGTHVVVASSPMHLDEEYFEGASEFQPFRFSKRRQDDGEDPQFLLASTSPSYIPFGYGHHACPGRFFASSVMKAMMAYLVLNYDIKLEKEGERPPDEWFMMNCSPNRKAEVMFRRRRPT
ncbi:cytochrome P450 [Suillus clintonianus]|uniref:cytochrome P450 n=1 Tax=Suillus clintonianus TaxID=1904413 RepID=UPI001B87C8A9|nr:cytochrome P450 [Suillus clintonianus]KAG2154646.1 cytochrome P450 [Suillus clintonianus]